MAPEKRFVKGKLHVKGDADYITLRFIEMPK